MAASTAERRLALASAAIVAIVAALVLAALRLRSSPPIGSLLREAGLDEATYAAAFALKNYAHARDVLLVSERDLAEDVGLVSLLDAHKLRAAAQRACEPGRVATAMWVLVVVLSVAGAGMAVASKDFRKGTAELGVIGLLFALSFGMRTYRKVARATQPAHVAVRGPPPSVRVRVPEPPAEHAASSQRGKRGFAPLACCFGAAEARAVAVRVG